MTVRLLGLSFELWLILIFIESDIGLIEVIETPPSCYFLWLGLAGTLWAVAGDHRVAPHNWAPSLIFWQDIILIITSLVHRQDIIIIIKITRPKPAYGRQGLAGRSLRPSDAPLPLGSGKWWFFVTHTQTLHHNIYIITNRPQSVCNFGKSSPSSSSSSSSSLSSSSSI